MIGIGVNKTCSKTCAPSVNQAFNVTQLETAWGHAAVMHHCEALNTVSLQDVAGKPNAMPAVIWLKQSW